MSEPVSISSGIAARYGVALYELSREDRNVKQLAQNLSTLAGALSSSEDMRSLISSPVYTREEQGRAIAEIAKRLELSDLMVNTLALMASKRRLFVLPQLLADVQERIAKDKGQLTAEITSAVALSKEKTREISAVLSEKMGQNVVVKPAVDESIIGGLVVKIGSKMVDTSIKSKLAALRNIMKEVG